METNQSPAMNQGDHMVDQPMMLNVLYQMLTIFEKDPSKVQVVESEGRMICCFMLPVADESGERAGALPVMVEVAITPILTMDQASNHVGVSTRTLGRWRKEGLPTIEFVCGRGDRRLPMFPLRYLDKYCQENHLPQPGRGAG